MKAVRTSLKSWGFFYKKYIMTKTKLLKLLIDQTENKELILGEYFLIYHDEANLFTLCDEDGANSGTANEILNHLK